MLTSFLLLPSRFLCARTIAQRGASLQKQHKGEERRFLQGLILRSWKKGSTEVSLSLSLFVPVQQPCFLMKMSVTTGNTQANKNRMSGVKGKEWLNLNHHLLFGKISDLGRGR